MKDGQILLCDDGFAATYNTLNDRQVLTIPLLNWLYKKVNPFFAVLISVFDQTAEPFRSLRGFQRVHSRIFLVDKACCLVEFIRQFYLSRQAGDKADLIMFELGDSNFIFLSVLRAGLAFSVNSGRSSIMMGCWTQCS